MILRLFRSLFRRSKEDVPPRLPYRCGTMFLSSTAEQRKTVFEAWQREERHYIAWVEGHPRPRPEWVEIAAELRQAHESEDTAY
jgi:hypothetical protein